MTTFTTLGVSSEIKKSSTGEKVTIYKVRKNGTKRVFFRPMTIVNGEELLLSSTLWARLGCAERMAKAYLNR